MKQENQRTSDNNKTKSDQKTKQNKERTNRNTHKKAP